MRKKLTIMGLITIILTIILTGCGGNNNTPSGNGNSTINPNIPDTTDQPTDEPTESVEPAEIDPVWVGTKKDVMFEYYLMFTSKTEVYVIEMVDGEVERIEKGTYSIDVDNYFNFEGISMIKKADYNASNKIISATMAKASLLYYFSPSNMEIYDKTTLVSLLETKGIDVVNNNKNPRHNDDGTYSYYVSEFELRSTINIWDYVTGEDFDLYRLLTDHGYEFNLHEYPNPQKGSNEVYPYKYINVARWGKKEIHLRPQDPWKDRVINEKGLASFESFMPAPSGYVFYPSSADKAEAIYSVNETDIGVSIDQMIFISCMIDYNAQGGLGSADFISFLKNNGNLIP